AGEAPAGRGRGDHWIFARRSTLKSLGVNRIILNLCCMKPEAKLAELGLTLPNPPASAGSYVPTVRTGHLLLRAGTICMIDGKMTHTGQVGMEHTIESGAKAAEICALNTLANIKAAVGSLDKVARIVMLNGFVNAVDGFSDSPAVINGASDLFL